MGSLEISYFFENRGDFRGGIFVRQGNGSLRFNAARGKEASLSRIPLSIDEMPKIC
ncbi:MAG: hypothetical protein ACD_28C00287G0004 [uncultured bacterium]|nr:MAG: hypothetical protein ACD_28C00287G0004 [uncultured bacterium]KKT74204.1 MAG: hypothetical protein UW70_C0063G0003 [Candidatus Peregrinibacteria bacterium GW2011_GWA2_44_7]